MTHAPIPLPDSFLKRPIAHRAYHDIGAGRPENSRAAILAAIEHGYGIELDLQLSKDAEAMVFHDYDMTRLTGTKGPIQQQTSIELGRIDLKHGNEGIPTFSEVLELVGGRVPLLVELKDQDGAMGPRVGALERATAKALEEYHGDVALMSFNPHSVAALSKLETNRPLGLTTEAFLQKNNPFVPAATRNYLRDIPDFERVGASFISHDVNDLKNEAVARLKAQNVPVLCWTVRSSEAETEARKVADNITFEGYVA
ncbi:glycerophosphodiester phosphodiesterase family protein [Aliiroseovarius sp. 2305UL8-7]|uniref:glycerophosphodiester phosphodiesterase family protein n=1 Tax=Aliiroseovarius conchicola TaxID=3121637 RepID=UPI003528EA42